VTKRQVMETADDDFLEAGGLVVSAAAWHKKGIRVNTKVKFPHSSLLTAPAMTRGSCLSLLHVTHCQEYCLAMNKVHARGLTLTFAVTGCNAAC
jgi:hypothetical protein